MQKNDVYSYPGTDNLEIMSEAINYNAYLAQMVKLHTASAERIIDFGAGIGTFAWPLHAAGSDIVAVEPDDSQRSHMAALGIPCVADIEQVANGWADAIYSLNVLEHIEDDVATLCMLHSKLKLGGVLFIYVPAFQLLYSAMDRKVGHYRRYRRSNLVSKITSAGFRLRQAEYVDSLGFVATLAYKTLGSEHGDIDREALKLYDRFVFPASRVLDLFVSSFIGKNLCLVATKG